MSLKTSYPSVDSRSPLVNKNKPLILQHLSQVLSSKEFRTETQVRNLKKKRKKNVSVMYSYKILDTKTYIWIIDYNQKYINT